MIGRLLAPAAAALLLPPPPCAGMRSSRAMSVLTTLEVFSSAAADLMLPGLMLLLFKSPALTLDRDGSLPASPAPAVAAAEAGLVTPAARAGDRLLLLLLVVALGLIGPAAGAPAAISAAAMVFATCAADAAGMPADLRAAALLLAGPALVGDTADRCLGGVAARTAADADVAASAACRRVATRGKGDLPVRLGDASSLCLAGEPLPPFPPGVAAAVAPATAWPGRAMRSGDLDRMAFSRALASSAAVWGSGDSGLLLLPAACFR